MRLIGRHCSQPREDGVVSCEVTRLLRELCNGARNKKERVSGARNAQLLCVKSTSPQTPTMPQLLRILEETIQKKSPRSMNLKPTSIKDAAKYRMAFHISDKTVESLMQYRTKFVQHMLTSAMYANSSIEKPWEMVNIVSEKILDELLLKCAKEMQLYDVVRQMYQCETQ
ncbi:unnamed protein product, partial [Iphiclides podalirius]